MIKPAQGRITQGFSASHQAIDYGGGRDYYNSPIVAPEAGTVTFVGQMGSGTADAGLVVQIGTTTNGHRLCHLAIATVKVGQNVKAGQQVGKMGYSGYTIPSDINGTHLHWIVFKSGKRVDGSKLVKGTTPPSTGGNNVFQNDKEVQEAYKLLRGSVGTAAERKSWIGQPKQRFFQVGLAEANSYRADLAAQKKKVASLQAEVNQLKKNPGTGNPADTQDAGKFRQILQILGIKK